MKNAECPKVNFTIYFIGLNPGKLKKIEIVEAICDFPANVGINDNFP